MDYLNLTIHCWAETGNALIADLKGFMRTVSVFQASAEMLTYFGRVFSSSFLDAVFMAYCLLRASVIGLSCAS